MQPNSPEEQRLNEHDHHVSCLQPVKCGVVECRLCWVSRFLRRLKRREQVVVVELFSDQSSAPAICKQRTDWTLAVAIVISKTMLIITYRPSHILLHTYVYTISRIHKYRDLQEDVLLKNKIVLHLLMTEVFSSNSYSVHSVKRHQKRIHIAKLKHFQLKS